MRTSPQVPRIYEGPEAVGALATLGLTEEDIIAAVEASVVERRSCSSLEPTVAPGFKAWCAAFRTLVERKIPDGWVKTETKGLPRLLHPETREAFAVVTGDESTGRRGGEPKSKSPRGPQSVFLVRSNETQLLLFETPEHRALPDEAEQITRWLLIYAEGDEVRAELSLPVGLGQDNRLSSWQERILVTIPDLTLSSEGWDSDEDDLDLEISIRPRS